MEHIEFIPKAGACLATRNVIEQKGLVRWMVRGESQVPADNGLGDEFNVLHGT